MHSEPKQTKASGSGAEKVLLQGHARRTGGSCLKNPDLPKGFQQSIFKGQVRDGRPRVCDQLVHNSLTGCW